MDNRIMTDAELLASAHPGRVGADLGGDMTPRPKEPTPCHGSRACDPCGRPVCTDCSSRVRCATCEDAIVCVECAEGLRAPHIALVANW